MCIRFGDMGIRYTRYLDGFVRDNQVCGIKVCDGHCEIEHDVRKEHRSRVSSVSVF